MKKVLNEGNETHNFKSSWGSGTVKNYGSGSAQVRNEITVPVPLRQKITVPRVPVPVPQHCN